MKKLLILFIIIVGFSFTSCSKDDDKNSLQAFTESLEEAESYSVSATMKREYPPKYNYYFNFYYSNSLAKIDTNYEISNYGNVFFLDLTNEEDLIIYYLNDSNYKKESLNISMLDLSFKAKISYDDFFLNEDNEYEMNEEALKKFNFKEAKIKIKDDNTATIKAYITYNYVDIPVYINIFDINNTVVELPI